MSKSFILLTAIVSCFAFTVVTMADDHKLLKKVMKDGFKGDDSPMAKLLEGSANHRETKSLASLVRSMEGTKAPRGEQADYEAKVAELISALDAVVGGDKSDSAIGRLEKAQSCKACHSEHKPK